MVGISADYGLLDKKERELQAQRARAAISPTNPADEVALLLKNNPHVPDQERLKALTRMWSNPR